MGRIRTQLLLPNGQGLPKYIIGKNTNYNAKPTEWTLLHIEFTEVICDTKMFYDETVIALADLCFF